MRAPVLLFAVVTLSTSCQPEIVPEPYVPTDAHDAYRHALATAGLADTALGRDWNVAAEQTLRSPVSVEAPYRETIYVDPAEAFAVSYRLAVTRGQRTEIALEIQPPSDWRLFLDLFRLSDEPGEAPEHVASGSEGDLTLRFEPRRDGVYLLRLQSELLRGGNCTVSIENVASLSFPVDGRDTGSIGSGFGVPREGGRRQHHGVDIFAPRHTEVLATSRARVRRVDDWKLGGRVVWLEDPERGLRLYFAHLQTQDVAEGAWVEPGERIGTVGNSGNARTTPPHLHFGIYVRGEGPIDPLPFLAAPKRSLSKVRVDLDNLGRWMRSGRKPAPLLAGARGRDSIRELPPHTPLFVTAGADRRYRVALPNGLEGYLPQVSAERLETPVETLELTGPVDVLDRPGRDAAVTARVDAGSRLRVLGRFDRFLWIDREPDEAAPRVESATALRPAWIPAGEPSASAP